MYTGVHSRRKFSLTNTCCRRKDIRIVNLRLNSNARDKKIKTVKNTMNKMNKGNSE